MTMPSESHFLEHRDRMFGIAYRMLGTVADAEDVIQEAWLRWQQSGGDGIDNPRAWLTRVATRLSIDALRRVRRERTNYPGPWLPEPLEIVDENGGEQVTVLAQTLSIALLVMLDSLSPNERAAFVLREAFDMSHDDIAECLGAKPATCRQWLKRARDSLRGLDWDDREAKAERHLLERFVAALAGNDTDALVTLLKPDVVLMSDGGGKVLAATRPLNGPRAVSRFLHGITVANAGHARGELVRINGAWGMLVWIDDRLDSAVTLQRDGDSVGAIYIVRNPDKLAAIRAARARS